MPQPYRVAIIGCGGVSQMHFAGYRLHPDRVQVAAACDPSAEAREKVRREGIADVFGSVKEMIEKTDWTVAVVCTPTPVRKKVLQTLAAAGKHILVEKPMADSYQEALRIVHYCEDAGVQLAVDQNFRYHYPFHLARSRIEEGSLGKVLGILHQDMFYRKDGGWRLQFPRYALAVMGIHWLDGFRWILAREAHSLSCQTHSKVSMDCAGETDAFIQITFEGDTLVSYVQSFSSSIGRTETLILGEKGMLRLDYGGAALYLTSEDSAPTEQWANPYGGSQKPESAYECLNQLLTALENGTEPSNSGRDNLKTVGLLEAAYRSAGESRIVSFQEGVPQ